jgi:amino acid adenylation domain-containing protein
VSAERLLAELAEQGVQLKLTTDGGLSVRGRRGGLSDALRQRIADYKPVLIELLKQHQIDVLTSEALPTIAPDPAHWHDPFAPADLQAGFLLGQSEDMEFHVRAHQYVEKEFDELDVARLEQAFNAAFYRQRHNLPVVMPDGQLQVPREFHPLKLKVYDLRQLSEPEAQSTMLKTRAEMARQILPLDRWPTEDIRVSLYGEKRVRLHLNHNNFFGDGYSTVRLMAVAMEHYRDPQTYTELNLSFRDCALALAELEESPLGQASRLYWENRVPNLPGPPPVPRAVGLNSRVRSKLTLRKMRLPEGLWTQFKRYAAQFAVTPSNALTAVYAEVISHWSGSRHFLLNNMVTHRFPMHPEVKEVFGNFASLYPLEVDWREVASFSRRAQQLQQQLLTDMRHQYWSGMKVLQSLNKEQKTIGVAPCPFVVASGLFISGWEEFHYSCLETPQTLLDYQFYEVIDGSLSATWDVFEEFFPAGLIDAMQSGFELLLSRLAQDERAWSEISFDLLPVDQRGQRESIEATPCTSRTDLLHGGLATSAARHPHKPAIVDGKGTLTFKQLHAASNRLGRCLREAGARPGSLIAILHDKGVEQAVAVFGVLASGAAYVPIDPHWPTERIHYLLGSTDANIVVTSRGQKLPPLPDGIRVVYVDGHDLEKYPATPLPATQDPDDLAYVIFTSGSTGVPKGVMINHRGVLNTIADVNRRFGIGERDVLYGISSLYFDLSVYDLFGAAAAGATLVLPAATDDPDPKGWIDDVRHHGITVWNSVPALMQLLVDAAGSADVELPSLKTVMMSGDWIPVPLPEQIKQVAPFAALFSLGGATEASIWSVHYPIEKVDPSWPSIPYGRPLANQAWHVLGENGEDAPTWVPGYLHIGGEGLALGYWGDEAKTNAAFVRHVRTGERLYKTGDLGRYLPDGSLEFLGRADFQVKIQGYRVEPGEVETVLAQHPDVRAAAVTASATVAGKQLVAFVVPEVAGEGVNTELLQDYLRGKLPAYMMPAHILPLKQLPLTANGKVNRAALAKLGPASEARREFVAPRDVIEKELVAIWEEVLATSPIGICDDFFDLGGQSFAAVRVMTRIAQQFGRRLPLSALVEGRSIVALARSLQANDLWSPLVQLRAKGDDTPCFFVHPAGGNVLCYRGLAGKLDRPFYGLQAPGLFGEQPPLDNVEQMGMLYREALQKAWPSGPYLLGGWSSGGMIAFEIARQLEMLGEEIERVIMVDAPAPMQNGPVDDFTLLLWFLDDLDLGIDTARLRHDHVSTEADPSLTAVLEQIREQQGLGHEIDPEQLQHVLSVFKRVVRAGRDYRPGAIDADITVLRAKDGDVSEFADHPAFAAIDWGWREFTRGQIECSWVPGTHYTVLQKHNLDALVDALSATVVRQQRLRVVGAA